MVMKMQRVRLEVESGELVHEGLVLPFNDKPVVLLWGVRAFVYDRSSFDGETLVDHYRERFNVHLVLDAKGEPNIGEGWNAVQWRREYLGEFPKKSSEHDGDAA